MISVPNLPTDSLYKFMFIFGLILIIFSAYNYSKTSVGTTDYKGVSDSLFILNNNNLKLDTAKYLLENVGTNNAELYFDVYTPFKVDSVTQSQIDYSLLGLSVAGMHILDDSASIAIRFDEKYLNYDRYIKYAVAIDSCRKINDNRIAVLTPKLKQYEIDVLTFKVTAILGSFLFLLGGFLWYMKIQRKQDKLLDLEVKRAIRDYNSTSA